MEVRHHKHTHTVTKNFHHYHKPRKSLKDITSQDLKHEHVHHHYRDEDGQLLTANDNAYIPSSSDKKENTVRFHDNFVNIENEALESLAVVAFQDTVEPAASVQSSSTKLPPVVRSRTHANSRRRSATTRTPSTTTDSSTTHKTTTTPTTDDDAGTD